MFGIDDAIIAGIIALIGSGISAYSSSSSSSKQAVATEQTNEMNMSLNQKELGISKEQADTSKFTAQQNAQQNALDSFNKKIKGTDLGNRIYGIWSGKATV